MFRLSSFPTIRRTSGPAVVLAAALTGSLGLTACGQGAEGSGTGAAEAPKPPAPTEAEKAALLASLPAPYDQADLENGRRAFARCRSCHTITPGGPNMTGPNLYGVFGSKAGARDKYSYSHAMRTSGFTWDAETLDHWLQNPRTFLPGNKMSFAGLPDATDRRDVIAFLKVETGFKPTGE
ncbi:cytochrome c family protein [Brevundimonas sp.]|uniref:c-type cytochrome n=1 Tax=Brevundimonas sp. TaxID=1871086 RepID=UPI0028A715A0|nr:cytochrome c family protein [Brevundimonas sp.]